MNEKVEMARSFLRGFYKTLASDVKRPFVVRQQIKDSEKRRGGRYTSTERAALREQWSGLLSGRDPELVSEASIVARECLQDIDRDENALGPTPPATPSPKGKDNEPSPV